MDVRKAAGQVLASSVDGRGKHVPNNKTPERQLNLIRQHINSYPRMESHYCRQTTKRQYLDSSLSVAKMYEQFVLYYHQQLQLENQHEGGTCLVTQHSGGGAAVDGENSIIIPADNSDVISQCSTVVRTVVRATQQVNGKWQFWGCQNSVTPEPIN